MRHVSNGRAPRAQVTPFCDAAAHGDPFRAALVRRPGSPDLPTPLPHADLHAPRRATIDALGWLLHYALPPLRLDRLVVYDAHGATLWQSAGHAHAADRDAPVACAALAAFRADAALGHVDRALADGRTALALPLRTGAGEPTGTALLLADSRVLQAAELARLLTPQLREILHRMGRALAARGATPANIGAAARADAAMVSDAQADRRLSSTPPGGSARAAGACASPGPLRLQPLTRLKSGGRTHRYEMLPTGDARVAVAALVEWLRDHPATWQSEPASFCLPLTADALADEDLPTFVGDALARSRVDAECLGFRLPEALVRERRADARRFVVACERLGTFIVLDRFSPEAGLPRVLESRAVRGIALDPQLGNAVARERLARALVAALVQAARVLGLHCIAERVEVESARQWLAGIGVDFHRGGPSAPQVGLGELTGAAADWHR